MRPAACCVRHALLQRWCRLPYEVAAWLMEHGPCDRGETRELGLCWRGLIVTEDLPAGQLARAPDVCVPQ